MDTNKTPIEDLVNDALEHYEEASSKIHHWNSLIPKALRFYKKHYGQHETIVIFSDLEKERIQELLTDQRINCLNAFRNCDEPQAIGAAIMNAKEPDFCE